MRASRLLRDLQRLATEDSPARAAARVRQREVAEQVRREVAERFGEISAANAREAIDFQERRMKELLP